MAEDQILQQIKWIDNERKNDRKDLNKLQEQVKVIIERFEGLSEKIPDFADELTRLSEKSSRINSLDDALSKQREDFSRQLKELNTKRSKREDEKKLLDEKYFNAFKADLSELQTEVISIKSTIGEFQERSQNEKAIQEAMYDLKQKTDAFGMKIEEFHHSSMLLEEARKHDVRKVGDLSAEIAGVREKQEKYLLSQESMETRTRRLEENIQKIFSEEGDKREELDFWMQQQQSRLLDFERTWKDWLKRFEEFDEKALKIHE